MTPPQLPRSIREQINRLAHAAGVRHGNETKARLMAELLALAANGARAPELAAHLQSKDPQ